MTRQRLKLALDKTIRALLTEKRQDWINYRAVEFDDESRRAIIRRLEDSPARREEGSGDYLFQKERQFFRARQNPAQKLTSAPQDKPVKGHYKARRRRSTFITTPPPNNRN
jgi:hypothetical protein